MPRKFYLGVDVGSGSARAGLFDAHGKMYGNAVEPIKIHHPHEGFAEQSSKDIWQAVCAATKKATKSAAIDAAQIKGIGFDATCSLVAIGENDPHVTVSPSNDPYWDVVMWMDHRAGEEAKRIDQTGASFLKTVGGSISIEMQLPKLLWLKNNMPSKWNKFHKFFDLPDWLVYRSTGKDIRSLCSTVCKWAYQGEKGQSGEGWDTELLTQLGLSDLADNNYIKIGDTIHPPGKAVGRLSQSAAQELGLTCDTIVAASLIDAYSGALGTIGVETDSRDISNRLALIAGTSACHIGLAPDANFVPGVWGPYYGALLPEYWALEAGQSAAGALIDTVIERHSSFSELKQIAKESHRSVYAVLDEYLSTLAGDRDISLLTQDRHVQPDFHGNRSPLADPDMRGAISGLGLSIHIEDLALDYLAAIQALAYGTCQILDAMREQGIVVDTLIVSGGLAKNQLYLQSHADATGCRIIVPEQQEPVLLGSAMLASVAAGGAADLQTAMADMSGVGKTLRPNPNLKSFHDRKYSVFKKMQRDFVCYRNLMNGENDA